MSTSRRRSSGGSGVDVDSVTSLERPRPTIADTPRNAESAAVKYTAKGVRAFEGACVLIE